MSLRLSNDGFNFSFCDFFETLPRENIRQLDFASSQFSKPVDNHLFTKPIFRNLKKIKYTCVHREKVDTTCYFADLMLTGCEITHFEIQHDSSLYCCGARDHKNVWEYENLRRLMEIENPKYLQVKATLLKKL